MNIKIGIKTRDSRSRILTRGAFISDGLAGLIADLGDGFFVVTEEAAEELANLGVDYKPVEIVNGVPSSVRKFIRDTYAKKGLIPPF